MLSLGIDIGSFSIKVAKIRSLPKGYEVLALSEYPLPQDPNKDTQIDIIEALRDIYKRFWEEGIHVVAGAHQFDVSLRRRDFPFRERHKILKSLPFELEDDIPLSIENSVFDAKISHYTGNTAHVLAVACPKSHVLDILKRFNDGGIVPDTLSVDSIAAANLFEEWRDAAWEYPEKNQAVPDLSQVDLILDIGHRTTTAAVIKDGYLLDIRLIDWGGKDLAETISSRYSIHYLEALKELRRKAFILTNNEGATKEQIALSEVIKSSVDVLAQKLRLVLLDMSSLHHIEYRQTVMTGGVSQLRNLGAYLTQKTEMPINRLGRLDMMASIDFAASPNNEIAAVSAIGLAVEGIKRPKNPAINLLKGDFARQNQSLKVLWETWGSTVKMISLCFVLIFFWGMMRDSFSFDNVEVAYETLKSQAVKVLGSKRPSEREIKTYIKTQDQKLKLKETIEGLQNINSALDILKKIAASAPAGAATGMNVSYFNVTKETVVITGEASQTEAITKLESVLKALAMGGKIKTVNPPPAKKSGYKSFSYEIKMERRGAH